MQQQLSSLMKLVQFKHVDAEEREALACCGYTGLDEHWCVDYENTDACKGIVGVALVDTLMWMGGGAGETRAYTNRDVAVHVDAQGGMWVTEEQEKEYFL